MAILLASTRIYLAVTATAVSDDNSLTTAWEKTRGQIFNLSSIGFLAGLKLFLPTLLVGCLTGLLEFALGGDFYSMGQALMIWSMMVFGMIVFLPLGALLYAHFYSHQQSPGMGDGGLVGN